MDKIKVIAVDDQNFQLSSITEMLSNEEEIELVATARTDDELYKLLKLHQVDVILLDVEMPSNKGKDGIEIARELKAKSSEVKVICLSVNTQSHVLRILLQDIKVDGYLDKNETDKAEIREAITKVNQNQINGPFVSQNLRKKVQRILNERDIPIGIDSLTKREKDIVPFIAKGMKNSEISDELYDSSGKLLSAKTIDNHRTNIYQKLECNNGAQVAEQYFNYMRLQSDDLDEIPNFKKDGKLPK